MTTQSQVARRCAVYTRKSSDEGLDQAFNSLDAQRESGEAHIAAMKGEGWVCLPERYDDGGFSGGNMDRPALKRLMIDIEAGRIDTVVVYKIDRLSRSLADFARMMEVFDKHGVSFVAVTQQFSTTNSMGRLMLNVLLSFAQFEREIASERTRDKIAASRRKGKWTGGKPILGYDIEAALGGNRLAVNEAEARRVREIYSIYLRLGSLRETAIELGKRGWRTKAWTTKGGTQRGGRAFDKGAVFKVLTNTAYTGVVKHKKDVFPGEHTGILDPELFKQVSLLLASHGRGGSIVCNNRHGALLKKLLHCGGCGVRMGHSFAGKRRDPQGRLYRYYVCQTAQAKGKGACSCTRGGGSGSIPADQVESIVIGKAREAARGGGVADAVARILQGRYEEKCRAARLELRRAQIDLEATHREQAALAAKGNVSDTDRAAALDTEAGELEQRCRACERALADLEADPPDPGLAAEALERFDELWMMLSPKERATVLEQVFEQVEFDRAKGEIAFHYKPGVIGCAANGKDSGLRQHEEAA
ncbi:MAG: recombinase family protein [Phycisphaerales bacterium]